MTIKACAIGSIHHLLTEEIELADADAAVISTATREPMACPKEPGAEGAEANDSQSDWRIIERLPCHWIQGRQAKYCRDKANPKRRKYGYGS